MHKIAPFALFFLLIIGSALLLPSDFLSLALVFFQEKQQLFRETISANLQTLHAEHSIAAWASVMFAGFLYGLLHAIGPGHGKVIVATYMLANNATLKRGLRLTAVSSLMQGITAIVLVVGSFMLFKTSSTYTEKGTLWLENASYLLVFCIGMALVWRGCKALIPLNRTAHTHHEGCGHNHGHHAVATLPEKNARAFWVLAFSIGLRPCSGAILVLLFACMINVIAAGIATTIAMAIGTAISTMLVAVASIQTRKWTLNLLNKQPRKQRVLQFFFSVMGGFFIMLIAGLLLAANNTKIAAKTHPLLHTRGQ